jgi:hypothetical protein
MKASELRIGNSIMQDDDFVFVTWWRLELMEKNKLEYKPIPLSEGWLIKFGFDKLENDIPTYFKCFGNLIEDDYEFSFNIYVDSELSYFITVFGRKIIIKYIHQLQNLYHALTEEELTIKDEVY